MQGLFFIIFMFVFCIFIHLSFVWKNRRGHAPCFFSSCFYTHNHRFCNKDFTLWPGAAQSLLFFLMFIGGSSGSTAGGIKVVRWTVLFKQATNEIKKMLHPHGVYTIRLNQKAGRKDLVFLCLSLCVSLFYSSSD